MTDRPDPRDLTAHVRRALPALALLLALALWVTAVPSKPPTRVAAGASLLEQANQQATGPDVTIGPDGTPAGGPGGPAAPGVATNGGPGGTGAAKGPAAKVPTAPNGKPIGGGTVGFTGEDCSRQKININGRTCRPTPAFKGDNGGAVTPGVTKDKVKVVYYQAKNNPQVQAILAQAGTATDADREGSLRAMTSWFNKSFELYGRQIEIAYVVGASAGNDPSGQQADAIKVATEHKPLFVISTYASPSFYTELHRRGITAFTWNQFSESFHNSLSPHLFAVFPDRDIVLDQLAEYYCKRLAGKNASYAGDPVFQSGKRKLGIVYQDETDNGPYFEKKLKATCGATVDKMLSYPADIGNAVAISTNAVAQLQQAGITTVSCICDVIAPIFFTAQATKQGWLPEWIHNGFFVTDADAAGRLYDQTQWRHSFGPATIPLPIPLAQSDGFRICSAGGGDKTNCIKGAASSYSALGFLVNTLEQLGPRFTANDIGTAFVQAAPIEGKAPFDTRASFGKGGPGFYSLIDNSQEIWYDATRTGSDGKTGAAFYVSGGRRYIQGQWPSGEPVVFKDDGSKQPPRDPDRS
jgi:hypothetical protein